MRRWLFAFALLLVPRLAAAQAVTADLSSHLVAISAGFTGTEVVLFGTVSPKLGDGRSDIVVVVRGPDEPVTLRRKERIAGIWLNTKRVVFPAVPSFYQVVSSRPLSEIAAPEIFGHHHIGVDTLSLAPLTPLPEEERVEFLEALMAQQRKAGLYPAPAARINFLGNGLFRSNLVFPADVPTGTYLVTLYVFRESQLVAEGTIPMLVSPVGVGATVVDFAYHRKLAYGIVAVALAALAGWGASVALRRA
jgi:uncharacterized protein (TIGR02186 family)